MPFGMIPFFPATAEGMKKKGVPKTPQAKEYLMKSYNPMLNT
jgi:hypothetical protein